MIHVPVLVNEILELLDPKAGDSLLDGTVGTGGHSLAFLERVSESTVLGLDADKDALAVAAERLQQFGKRVELKVGNFSQMKELAAGKQFDYILLDLGIGSHQIADTDRGFSFASETSMKMRFGEAESLPPSQLVVINELEERLGHAPDADEMVKHFSAEQLAEVLIAYGEERQAKKIAAAIAGVKPKTSQELAYVVEQVVSRKGKLHPATLTFQALRLAANRELEALMLTLPQTLEVLAPAGKLAVISWHSLEDRITKRFIARDLTLNAITKKPVMAQDQEVEQNPRARSAKLRVAQKININTNKNSDSKHFTTSSSA